MMNRLFSNAKPVLVILAALLAAGCSGGRGISDSKNGKDTLAVIEIVPLKELPGVSVPLAPPLPAR